MQNLIAIIFFLGGLPLLAAETNALPLAQRYAEQGSLIVVKLDTAPFPHPDRTNGHTYSKKFFSGEDHYSDNRVALFIPKGFRGTNSIDFVIHFHGWMNHIEGVLANYDLIPQFMAAGKNAILIVPQGPKDAPDSFGGRLADENGFKRFMADVLKTLQTNGVSHDASIGNIILSGHSGGYSVISQIVARGGLAEHVKEVWLFDALYGNAERFTGWYKKFPDRRWIDIYTAHGGTKEETEKLMAAFKAENPPVPFIFKKEAELSNADLRENHLIFIDSPLEHNEVVNKEKQFERYLKTSCLTPIQ